MPLDKVLYRTPMFDPQSGNMTREWIRYFDQQSNAGKWQAWPIVITALGSMTVSGLTTHDAQFMRVGDSVFFKLYVDITLGGSASNQIFVSLPVPVAGVQFFTSSTFTVVVRPGAGTWFPSWGFIESAGNLAKIQMPNEVNFPLGACSFMIEGFYKSN